MSGSEEGTDTTTEDRTSSGQSSSDTSSSGTSDTTGASSTSSSGTSTSDVTMADWVENYIRSSQQTGSNALSGYEDMLRNYQLDPTSMQTLSRTAAGDYLYGGQAQQAYVDAAQRAAMPGVLSTFGSSGRGTGGLAQHAIAQSGIDSYAGLYNQERDRMEAAAKAIPGLQLLPFDLQRAMFDMASSVPSSYSSLFGTSGTQAALSDTTSSESTASTGTAATNTASSETGTTDTTTPTHEDPDWMKFVDLGTAVAGLLAAPVTGGASAAAAGAATSGGTQSFLSRLIGNR